MPNKEAPFRVHMYDREEQEGPLGVSNLVQEYTHQSTKLACDINNIVMLDRHVYHIC
jgi:hypothetical protein